MDEVMVSSTSDLKNSAVQRALALVGYPDCAVQGVNAKTPFPEQPVDDETYAACTMRLSIVSEMYPGKTIIAIESGIFQTKDGYEDRAIIALRMPNGDYYHESAPIPFPTDAVEEARRRGFATTTVGSVLRERIHCMPDNPHWMLTANHPYGRVSRRTLLTIAVAELLLTALQDGRTLAERAPISGSFSGKTHHVVHIPRHGDMTLFRILPILDVGDGKRLALFDLLGDHELCEAAGGSLVNHAFSDTSPLQLSGVDAFVMPDGKAQALLHVIGRVAERPTVVARKTIKPYMRDVVSVEVKSITTDTVQQLHLSGESANALRGKRVVIVDDVVSSGGTLDAMRLLLAKVGAIEVATIAVFTEGTPRSDVISLGHLPLF